MTTWPEPCTRQYISFRLANNKYHCPGTGNGRWEREGGRQGQNERQIKINSVWKCFCPLCCRGDSKIVGHSTEAKLLGESISSYRNI